MKHYKVIKKPDFGSGMIPNSAGELVPMQSFAPEVGSIVSGEIESRFVFNKQQKGLTYIATNQTKFFIPESCLELMIDDNAISTFGVVVIIASVVGLYYLLS